MARWIDGDALIAWIKETQHQTSKMKNVICKIKTMPSEDRPHGEWIESEYQNDADVANGNYAYVCSNCHHTDTHAKTQRVPYCWYCGADMRGEDHEQMD